MKTKQQMESIPSVYNKTLAHSSLWLTKIYFAKELFAGVEGAKWWLEAVIKLRLTDMVIDKRVSSIGLGGEL